MKVIRCGQRDPRKELPYITQEQLSCLEGFWSLEEQLGLRKKPEDDFLSHIPQIVRNPNGDQHDAG